MEDTLPETDAPGTSLGNGMNLIETAAALGELLRDHKGADAVVLDLRGLTPLSGGGAWTDFFVIATSSSGTHMDGLDRHIEEFCRERGIDILRRSHKPAGEDEWRIIDLGPIVIHLMNSKARAFYDLERLYSIAGMNKRQQ
ncbi:MAG: ribosome silencing factor [Treponema sp.]|jgi:ribosome-associated protein|nr:ribosome silencing factor [Treponema sp.]